MYKFAYIQIQFILYVEAEWFTHRQTNLNFMYVTTRTHGAHFQNRWVFPAPAHSRAPRTISYSHAVQRRTNNKEANIDYLLTGCLCRPLMSLIIFTSRVNVIYISSRVSRALFLIKEGWRWFRPRFRDSFIIYPRWSCTRRTPLGIKLNLTINKALA